MVGFVGLWCLTPLIMVVSFIGGGNGSTRRKPPTCFNQIEDYHDIKVQQNT
jgi:hypothetical protein